MITRTGYWYSQYPTYKDQLLAHVPYRTWTGVGGAALILSVLGASWWQPLAWLGTGGAFAIAWFYRLLHGAGPGTAWLSFGWLGMGTFAVLSALNVPWSRLGVGLAGLLIGFGYVSIALRRGSHVPALFVGSLIGLLVPILAATVAWAVVVSASSGSEIPVASSRAVGILLGGLIGAQAIATGVAAFGTDDR